MARTPRRPRNDTPDTIVDGMDIDAAIAAEQEAQMAEQMELLAEADEEAQAEDDEFGPMSDEDYETLISGAISAAEDYIDEDLSPERELAARYYRGEKFGNEEAGRSQIVMTEVRDSVLGVLAPLVEVFMGTENPIEFEAGRGTPQDQADIQTDYINHVIFKDNDGFSIYLAAFKDALIRKTGIFTWEWEEIEMISKSRFTGLSEEALLLLKMEATDKSDADENLEYFVEVDEEKPDETQPQGNSVPDEMSSMLPEDAELTGQAQPMIYSGTVSRRIIRKRVKIDAVPPEEYITSPTTTMDIDRIPLVGRRQMKTISEIVALGHDEELVRELIGGHGDKSSTLIDNVEATDRNDHSDRIFDNGISEMDPSSEYTKYCQIYVLVDRDNDGIAERRKVITIGDNNKILYDEVYDDDIIPYSTICPDPEPHSQFGYSVADQTMDIQEIKSEMVRGTLDSLANSIIQRMGIIEGQVNIDDALNNQNGQLIRMKRPDGLFPINQTFVGMNVLPVMEYIDVVKTRRTGVNPASPSGLDPDALQSTAKEGVSAAVDASQERIRLIARIFAETGIKRLVRGVRNLCLRHQDHRRMLRLRGEMVTVDPRSWNADLDIQVNVGVGRGTESKKIQALMFILGQQKEIFQTYGANNPVVSIQNIAYTVERIIRASGFNDVYRFIQRVTPEVEAGMKQAAAEQAKKLTPEELLAQAQDKKTMAGAFAAAEKERTARLKLAIEDDQRRDAGDQNFYLKAAELLGKFGVQVSEQEMRQKMEEDRGAEKLADQATQGVQQQMNPQGSQT